MITGILVTDNGPHPVEDWSYATAGMLLEVFKVDPHSPRRTKLEMMKDRIRPKLAEILIVHHDNVQKLEREMLAAGKHDRLLMDLDVAEHTDIDSAIDEIYVLVEPLMDKSQLFEAGDVSANPIDIGKYMRGVIRERVETDLRTSMHIERSWHADRNPNNEHAMAFRAVFHGA